MSVEFKTDKEGHVRGPAGAVVMWCERCEYISYGLYCIACGHVTRQATIEDIATFSDTTVRSENG